MCLFFVTRMYVYIHLLKTLHESLAKHKVYIHTQEIKETDPKTPVFFWHACGLDAPIILFCLWGYILYSRERFGGNMYWERSWEGVQVCTTEL